MAFSVIHFRMLTLDLEGFSSEFWFKVYWSHGSIVQFRSTQHWQPRLLHPKCCSGFPSCHPHKLVSIHLVSLSPALTHFTRLPEWSFCTFIWSCIPFGKPLSRALVYTDSGTNGLVDSFALTIASPPSTFLHCTNTSRLHAPEPARACNEHPRTWLYAVADTVPSAWTVFHK